MASDTIKRNVAEVRAVMGTDAKRIDEAGRRAMQKHIAPTVPPGVKRDMILVERVTDGERCQYVGANPGHPTEGRKGCPFLIAYDEEVGEHYALHTYYFCMTFQERLLSSFTKTPCRLEITRCPACLATPSAVVVTPEMMEAVKRILARRDRDGVTTSGIEAEVDALERNE